jgi:hypothetical protein
VSGVFAEWQPRYAKHGVATFPVENKRPCVRHWQKVGLKGSSQLALKFAAADAFGFKCGERNQITLIDIDSNDARMVAEAINLFGKSPIIWRTGAGITRCRSVTTERRVAYGQSQACQLMCLVAALPWRHRAWAL